MNLIDKIKELSRIYFDENVNNRHFIHQHPELSQKEFETADFIAEKLFSYGIEPVKGIGGTGVVGLINGMNHKEKCVALRADFDALPINELTELEYKSLTPGIMHACGHDFHAASLLGTARILNELKDCFEGCVKLIFQPSEELYPGGARMMINDGVLENPKPDVIIGQHVLPQLQAGYVGFVHDGCMASSDELFITVKGRGGHAAMPHNCIDPILIASHIVVALQQVVSRKADPDKPTVLSFGKFIAEGRTNVIPDEVKIEGTLRTYDKMWRDEALSAIKFMAENIAMAMGGECNVVIVEKYPAVINDDLLTDIFYSGSIDFLGNDFTKWTDRKMTAEDFGVFSQIVPSCFYRIGTGNPELGCCEELHTSKFNTDDKALVNSVGLMAYLAVLALENR